jgi:opacity protein-like surface antigen
MKKLIIAALALCCATALTVQAQDAAPKKHTKLTAEQQKVMTELLAKYDTNKDGKLDKTEKSAMTQEDKDKLIAAGLGHAKKKAGASTATNAPAADAGK